MTKAKRVTCTILILTAAAIGLSLALLHLRPHAPMPDYLALVQNPPASVSIEEVGTGNLRVSWLEAAKKVDIGIASSAEMFQSIFRPIAAVKEVGRKSFVIDGLDLGKRYYIRLAFERDDGTSASIIAAKRYVSIPGAMNFRDVGGYETQDGKRVKWGRLFRSGDLSALEKESMTRFSDLRLGSVFDLRHDGEVEKEPDRIPPGVVWKHVPIYGQDEEPGGLWVTLRRNDVESYWTDFNVRVLAEEKAKAFGHLINMIAENIDEPVLIHCSAGKDRAGIAAALILLALGVPEDTVADDYTLSNLSFPDVYRKAQRRFESHGTMVKLLNMDAVDIAPFFLAQRSTIEAVMKYIKQEYGAYDFYLVNVCGVEPDTLSVLRAHLLE